MPRKCSICEFPGHTRRSCPFLKDVELSKSSVFCYDCVLVTIPYKTLTDVTDVEGKKAQVNNILCGRCESSNIEHLHKVNTTIRVQQKRETNMKSVIGSNTDSNDTCCICFEEYSNKCNMAVTLCGHAFCLECILKHSKEKSDCPLCRANLFKKQQKHTHDEWKIKHLENLRRIVLST